MHLEKNRTYACTFPVQRKEINVRFTMRYSSRKLSDEKVITPGGGGYSHTLPIRVCAAQRGRDFEAPDLERGIHFRGVF